jgi:predicted phage baseplate assembly protein
VEFEHGHRPVVRFGDGRRGRRPMPGTAFTVRARLGTGPAGNVGADALSRLVVADPTAVRLVRNPRPATGGRAAEPRDRIVASAPTAFRTQRRAVTIEDWVEVAERHPEVQRAAARLRWTGSWWTVFVAVDRVGGGGVLADEALAADLRDHLGRFRLAGIDLELVDPVFVPLELAIEIAVEPGRFRSDVAGAVREALSPGPHPNGSMGLFHPDRLTFGQPLHISAVHAAIDAAGGVRCAEIVECHPLGRAPAGELANGIVAVGPGEVLRLDDDPRRPEHGRLRIDARGGV